MANGVLKTCNSLARNSDGLLHDSARTHNSQHEYTLRCGQRGYDKLRSGTWGSVRDAAKLASG